jgi:hypothetical protein
MKAVDLPPQTVTRDAAGNAAAPIKLTAAQRQRAYPACGAGVPLSTPSGRRPPRHA